VKRTSAQVGVYAHVPSGATKGLSFTIWNVLLSFGVAVLLGHSKIHHEDHVLLSISADKKVIWLDIPIYQMLFMHGLNSCQLSEVKTRR
jgi:hypothetical protein